MGEAVGQMEMHLDVALLCVALLVAYFALIRRYGMVLHPHPHDPPVRTKQVVAFVAGVLAFWLADGWPLHDLAERYWYSAHMVQHLLQAFVVPPLLLLGIPRWMGELLLKPTWLLKAVRGLARPLMAALMFNGVLLWIHWPAVVGLMLRSEVFHAFGHFLLLGAAFFMWMNVVSPVPHLVKPLQPLAQMFYLFLMTLIPTIPSSFLTFGTTLLYPEYGDFPRLAGLSAIDDMQIAGLLMKVGGGFLLWGIITTMYFKWAAAQERAERAGRPGSPMSDAHTPA